MRSIFSLFLAAVIAASVSVLAQGNVAYAAFHCVRIHAVAGGINGSSSIQYVELRMDVGGQTLIAGHALQFFDSAGTLKATFTVPSNVANVSTGDSILIATSEFNANATGGTADFVFTGANTTGANGGDPLHPIQASNGSIVWAGPSAACVTVTAPVDSLAYGSATATYGTAATTLPSPGTLQVLRLSNLNTTPSNNSAEYTLQSVASSVSSLSVGDLPMDFSTPRNNKRTVIKLVGNTLSGVDLSSDGGVVDAATGSSGGDAGWSMYLLAGGVAAAAVACAGGWYVFRTRRV